MGSELVLVTIIEGSREKDNEDDDGGRNDCKNDYDYDLGWRA